MSLTISSHNFSAITLWRKAIKFCTKSFSLKMNSKVFSSWSLTTLVLFYLKNIMKKTNDEVFPIYNHFTHLNTIWIDMMSEPCWPLFTFPSNHRKCLVLLVVIVPLGCRLQLLRKGLFYMQLVLGLLGESPLNYRQLQRTGKYRTPSRTFVGFFSPNRAYIGILTFSVIPHKTETDTTA